MGGPLLVFCVSAVYPTCARVRFAHHSLMCFFHTSVLCRAWVRSKPQVIVTGKATSWLAPEGKQLRTEYLCEMCMCSCKDAYAMEARWDLLPAQKKIKKKRSKSTSRYTPFDPLMQSCLLQHGFVWLPLIPISWCLGQRGVV